MCICREIFGKQILNQTKRSSELFSEYFVVKGNLKDRKLVKRYKAHSNN